MRKGGSLLLRCLQSKLRSTPKQFHFCYPGKLFCNALHTFLVLRTPTRCSICYRFRGSPSLITPHSLPICNYASASIVLKKYWKLSLPEQIRHVLSSHIFWTSDLRTHQPGSPRRKVTQDFSTFLLRCLPYFLSREKNLVVPFPR